jgi:hypothetical protein
MRGDPDLIQIRRSDVAVLLSSLATARLAASEAYSSSADVAEWMGERPTARERKRLSARLRDNGDRLLEAAGVIPGATDPRGVLERVMPLVRERIGKGEGRGR